MRSRIPADVPLHRSVVGTSPTMGSQMPDRFLDGFTPYVYRGVGVDTLTPHLGEDESREETMRKAREKREAKNAAAAERRARPKPKRRKRKRPTYRPRLYPYYNAENSRLEPPPESRPLDISDERTWGNWSRPPEPEPEPLPPKRTPKPVHPAPGWKPTTGDDIDALLDELSD